MTNGLFTLRLNDFYKGLIMAIYGAIGTVLYNLVIVNGFDVFSVDYVATGKMMVNVSVVVAIVYLFKNFTSTDKGSVLGVTPDLSAPSDNTK